MREKALKEAQINNEPAPSSIQFVKTTWKKVNWFLSRKVVDSNEECYLVVMKGNFAATKAFTPSIDMIPKRL